MQIPLANLSRSAINWLIAILVSLALSASCLLDDPDELATIERFSSYEKDAQEAARNELMRERAAAQFCIRTEGAKAVATWGNDGVLLCKRIDRLTHQVSAMYSEI